MTPAQSVLVSELRDAVERARGREGQRDSCLVYLPLVTAHALLDEFTRPLGVLASEAKRAESGHAVGLADSREASGAANRAGMPAPAPPFDSEEAGACPDCGALGPCEHEWPVVELRDDDLSDIDYGIEEAEAR